MTDQAAPVVAPVSPTAPAPSTVAKIETAAASAAATVEAKAAGWWSTIWTAIKPSMSQAIAGVVLALLGVGGGMAVQTFRQAAAPPPKPEFVLTGSMEDVKPPLARIEGKVNQIIEEGVKLQVAPQKPVEAPPAARPRPRATKSSSWF